MASSAEGSFAQQLARSISEATKLTLRDIFGPDPEDTNNMRELFGLPLPTADDSVSTQRLMEQLHTEAALLKTALASSAVPSIADNPTMNRLMSAVAFIKELQSEGTSPTGINLRQKGFGDRRKIDTISQASINYAVELLMSLPPVPEQSPVQRDAESSLQAQPTLHRPATLPVVSSSGSDDSGNQGTAPRVKEVIERFERRSQTTSSNSSSSNSSTLLAQSARSTNDAAYKADLQKAIDASLIAQASGPEQKIGGLGSFLNSTPRSQAPSEHASVRSADVSAKLKLAKLHAEQLQVRQQQLLAEAEIARLEEIQAMQSSSSASADRKSEVAEPQTPKRSQQVRADPAQLLLSPSPDESQAAMLRAQLEEVEARLKASAAAAADPQLELQRKLNELALENELLKKAHASPNILPAPPQDDKHGTDPKQLVSVSKEAETCKVHSNMPTDKSYRFRLRLPHRSGFLRGRNRHLRLAFDIGIALSCQASQLGRKDRMFSARDPLRHRWKQDQLSHQERPSLKILRQGAHQTHG